MSESFKKESRRDWVRTDGQPSNEQLALGCFQRIADATELMARRHQELIDAKVRAERDRDYWNNEFDAAARRLVAARGQITKLKNKVAALSNATGDATGSQGGGE